MKVLISRKNSDVIVRQRELLLVIFWGKPIIGSHATSLGEAKPIQLGVSDPTKY